MVNIGRHSHTIKGRYKYVIYFSHWMLSMCDMLLWNVLSKCKLWQVTNKSNSNKKPLPLIRRFIYVVLFRFWFVCFYFFIFLKFVFLFRFFFFDNSVVPNLTDEKMREYTHKTYPKMVQSESLDLVQISLLWKPARNTMVLILNLV